MQSDQYVQNVGHLIDFFLIGLARRALFTTMAGGTYESFIWFSAAHRAHYCN